MGLRVQYVTLGITTAPQTHLLFSNTIWCSQDKCPALERATNLCVLKASSRIIDILIRYRSGGSCPSFCIELKPNIGQTVVTRAVRYNSTSGGAALHLVVSMHMSGDGCWLRTIGCA